MQPPLTSLSWIDWLVWADFCNEYRPKGEAFARKVAKSLRKMEAVGCDPKMYLVCTEMSSGVPYCVNMTQMGFSKLNGHRVPGIRSLWWESKTMYYRHKRIGPADLPKHWQDTRLAWKFWKCVNRRALGIKDSVIGE